MNQDISGQRAIDFITSQNAGFVFPVSEKIRRIDPAENFSIDPEAHQTISKVELLKAMLVGVKKAWKEGIQPLLERIRKDPTGSSIAKGEGSDFFTAADSASERIIKQYLTEQFGEEMLRIFAEEINDYTGNLGSLVTIRIDPIDGTEVFKYGKPDWGIMVGVYVRDSAQERQEIAVIYYPEYNEVMYHVDEIGTFFTDVATAETTEISPIPSQDDVRSLVVCYWHHPDPKKRGNLGEILIALEALGTLNRPMNSSAGDIREAMLTEGKRVIITEGGNQVDFIVYAPLVKLGYRIYSWDGQECNPDDPMVAQKKVVVVPPGKAGQEILETIIDSVVI